MGLQGLYSRTHSAPCLQIPRTSRFWLLASAAAVRAAAGAVPRRYSRRAPAAGRPAWYMMGKRKEEEEEDKGQATAACVPGDLLPEILSRVPYRSLCRFKCVSRAWLALCCHPSVRRRSPQTLSGFFLYSRSGDDASGNPLWELDLLNLSGRGRPLLDTSLRFLCGYEHVELENCCGGILLCSAWDRALERFVFVVCNPATKDIWAAQPWPEMYEPGSPVVYGTYVKCLCFNPAVPSRFAVFIFLRDAWQKMIISVQVYSSDTGEYTSMASGWGPRIMMLREVEFGYVFLNGNLHVIAHNTDDPEGNKALLIATVDMEGNTWSTISMPPKVEFSIIGQSQGRLCGMQKDDCQLSVWVLEDYASGQWTLKHTASVLELLGRPCHQLYESYKLLAMHPECNLIFLHDGEEAFMSYDMDNKKLHVICTLREDDTLPFWPYIPCFAEQPAVAQNNSELLRIH